MAEQDIPLVKVLDTKENNIFLEWWRRNCNLKKSKASFFFFSFYFGGKPCENAMFKWRNNKRVKISIY